MSPLGLGFNNCACCGADCTIFSDDFNRADAATPGANWTVVAGTWPIVSNELVPSTSVGRIRTVSPISTGTSKIEADVMATSDNTEIGISLDSDEVRMYLYVSSSGSTLNIVRGSFLLRSCPVTAALDTWYRLGLCTNSIMNVALMDGVRMFTHVGHHAAGEHGLLMRAGAGKFDNVVISSTYIDDPSCPECIRCCWPKKLVSDQFQVVLSGMTNGSGCSSCSSFNGTYILDKVSNGNCLTGAVNLTTCSCYELTGLSLPCGVVRLQATVAYDHTTSGFGCRLAVTAFDSGGATVFGQTRSLGAPCDDIPEDLSLTGQCTGTATVTAL